MLFKSLVQFTDEASLLGSLERFVNNTPDARFCALNIAKELEDIGFEELVETVPWSLSCYDTRPKGFYVVRDGSIIAFSLPESLSGFCGTITHTDSPHFKIKANPEIFQSGYVKLNVEPYGGLIYYSWLDRPLAICGVAVDETGKSVLVDTKGKHEVFVPSQAIHINREVNSKNSLNPQKDMLPVFSFGCIEIFADKIQKILGSENKIKVMDLALYNPEPVRMIKGVPVIMGPRLDNLSSVYAALKAFINSCNSEEASADTTARLFVALNSEEIGSMTYDGADSKFLTDVLERICKLCNVDKYPVFANSTIVNVDAAHAIHPNAPEKSDPTNIIIMGDGVVVKHNDNYAMNLELEAYLKTLARKCGVNIQDFYSKSDMRCGATLGNICMRHHGIKSIDIGIPMLAMHSAVETIHSADVKWLETLLYNYYLYI